jgi:hypothetical protein
MSKITLTSLGAFSKNDNGKKIKISGMIGSRGVKYKLRYLTADTVECRRWWIKDWLCNFIDWFKSVFGRKAN